MLFFTKSLQLSRHENRLCKHQKYVAIGSNLDQLINNAESGIDFILKKLTRKLTSHSCFDDERLVSEESSFLHPDTSTDLIPVQGNTPVKRQRVQTSPITKSRGYNQNWLSVGADFRVQHLSSWSYSLPMLLQCRGITSKYP